MTITFPKTMSFTAHGTEFTIPTDQWGEDFILAQVRQGILIRLQRAGADLTADKCGGKDKAAKARLEAAQDLAAAFAKGEVPSGGGGGGPRLSPVESILREYMIDALVNAGVKKADATKAAPAKVKALADKKPDVYAAWMEKAEAEARRRAEASAPDVGDLLEL